MGLTRSQFKHILNIIDQRRLKNQQIHYARKDKLYKSYPVLQTIDEQISSLSASLTRQIVENPGKRQELMTNLHHKINRLSQQKKETLLDAGYPSDYLAPIYDCEDCKDTGYIDHAKCHCLNQEIINFSYEQSHLNAILQKENFDNFSLDHYSSEVDKNIGKSPREIAAFNYNATASPNILTQNTTILFSTVKRVSVRHIYVTVLQNHSLIPVIRLSI